MATEDTIANCANCGKGEENSSDLKACTACKLVKYCNRECQIAHRPLHKRACKKRAAEIHDEELFKEHPPPEDCPICFLPLPVDVGEMIFKSCCGKLICDGCILAMNKEAYGRGKLRLCAFCREPAPSSAEDEVKGIKNLIEVNNANAFYNLAGYYARGDGGMPQDWAKANELLLKAGELGCAEAYFNLGVLHDTGRGVEMDKKKAIHYFEFAAMNGNVKARRNLGCVEFDAGNYHRAIKHFILAAKAGYKKSLDDVKEEYERGMVTKDEYAKTLRAYQKIQDEMKSDDRDRAREDDARTG